MEQQSGASTSCSNTNRINGSMDDGKDVAPQPKHKVFLSHSGFQKGFVERLCALLEGCYRFPFFDMRRDSLPPGEDFSRLIFDAIRQCHVGVVILSDGFLTSEWPMMELVTMHEKVLDEVEKEKADEVEKGKAHEVEKGKADEVEKGKAVEVEKGKVDEVEKEKADEVEKGKPKFKVIPVFLEISPEDLIDHIKCNQWFSCWQILAKKYPKMVQVEKWKAALEYLQTLGGLVHEGSGEVEFSKKIVREICRRVPAEIKMDDSYIQGRSRLCKIIQRKIDALRKVPIHGVCVLGLYGMGGIGKTSICKALRNEFFDEFLGKVCYAELERGSKVGLLREVLKSLTNTTRKQLKDRNEAELEMALKEGIIKDPFFLALDNMSDQDASVKEVQTYLSGKLPPGSIVMVTARSKDWLLRVRPYIDGSKCIQMPELMLEEAKSLFVKSSDAHLRDGVDEKLILRCVKRCYFQKEDDSKSCHYHLLALDVLGRQLSRLIDFNKWVNLLNRIDEDIFNQSRENDHPIFSILRKSFDALSSGDQMLFMDVALYLPYSDWEFGGGGYSVFEWLGMVHKLQRVDDVIRTLERLREKSLLERLGDGVKERIGMHDLWRAFCVAETQGGKMGQRRWVYDAVNCGSKLVEASPSRSCWKNVKRMTFLNADPRSLKKVKFGHFANVTVLKILMPRQVWWEAKKVVINLSGLIHLKSLEVWGFFSDNLVIQGLPRSLLFFFYRSEYAGETIPTEQFVKQIASLEDLQFLCLIRDPGRRLPDLRSMVSLRVAKFTWCENAVTLTGLSSKLTNLRVLDLQSCKQLRSCPGVGDLVDLEELSCWNCERLERLPSLRKLRNLRKLDISGCDLITELPGLGDLVALEELHASVNNHDSRARLKLPDLRKLKNLRVLDLGGRRLQAALGLDSLISLQKLEADFGEVLGRPNLRQLTKLQELSINGWSLAELRAIEDLAVLHTLNVKDCKSVDDLPDFQGATSLRKLTLRDCEFKDATSLSEMSTLEDIEISGCRQLEVLPDLRGLTRLESLKIRFCDMLRGWDSAVGGGEESSCKRQDCNMQWDRRDLQRLIGLRRLELETCSNFVDVTGIGAFRQLETLEIGFLPVRELPDLSNFPHLEKLQLNGCGSLTRLTSYYEPVPGLRSLTIVSCNAVEYVPDLGKIFPALEYLMLVACSGIVSLTSSEPLTKMYYLYVSGCKGVSEGDVDQLRALCPPQCSVYFKPYVEGMASETGEEWNWVWRILCIYVFLCIDIVE